jgi:hypothetical protein
LRPENTFFTLISRVRPAAKEGVEAYRVNTQVYIIYTVYRQPLAVDSRNFISTPLGRSGRMLIGPHVTREAHGRPYARTDSGHQVGFYLQDETHAPHLIRPAPVYKNN